MEKPAESESIKSKDEKTEQQAILFSNRLKRKSKELKKWARKNRISCYRLYDKDIPEIPVSLDIYEFLPGGIETPAEAARYLKNAAEQISLNNSEIQSEILQNTYAVLYLYERPYQKDEADEQNWLSRMAETASETLKLPRRNIVVKQRKRQRGLSQYEKNETGASEQTAVKGITQEAGQLFAVDLTTYLDTGLFFDHRPLREKLRDISRKKSVLNLFCYTGSFSVYAAQGGASKIESVDLSNTYLTAAKKNMALNGFSEKAEYTFIKTDCIEFLKEKSRAAKNGTLATSDYYDIIILDPPTFSNSKSSSNVLDINRDWHLLVKDCLDILSPCGILYFSTNSSKLFFDASKIPETAASGKKVAVTDITKESIPKDFEGTKCHKAWKFQIAQ